ncbi:MAG TPA: hypothetical protein VGL91_07100, partial [Acidobacteriota bacterium]
NFLPTPNQNAVCLPPVRQIQNPSGQPVVMGDQFIGHRSSVIGHQSSVRLIIGQQVSRSLRYRNCRPEEPVI